MKHSLISRQDLKYVVLMASFLERRV